MFINPILVNCSFYRHIPGLSGGGNSWKSGEILCWEPPTRVKPEVRRNRRRQMEAAIGGALGFGPPASLPPAWETGEGRGDGH